VGVCKGLDSCLADDPACRLQVTFVLNSLSVTVPTTTEKPAVTVFSLFLLSYTRFACFFKIICHPVSSLSLSLSSSGSASFFSLSLSHIVSRFPIYPFAFLLLLLFAVDHTHTRTHCLPICKITLPQYCTCSSELHAREHPHTADNERMRVINSYQLG